MELFRHCCSRAWLGKGKNVSLMPVAVAMSVYGGKLTKCGAIKAVGGVAGFDFVNEVGDRV